MELTQAEKQAPTRACTRGAIKRALKFCFRALISLQTQNNFNPQSHNCQKLNLNLPITSTPTATDASFPPGHVDTLLGSPGGASGRQRGQTAPGRASDGTCRGALGTLPPARHLPPRPARASRGL